MRHKHLTLDERMQLQQMLGQRLSFRAMGNVLNRDPTTCPKKSSGMRCAARGVAGTTDSMTVGKNGTVTNAICATQRVRGAAVQLHIAVLP